MSDDDNLNEGDIFQPRLKKEFMISVLMLIVVAAALVIGIMQLAESSKMVGKLEAHEPVNRAEQFSKRVDKALKSTKEKYAKHVNKMDDKSIFIVSDKFKQLYALSLESEKDNTLLLFNYQKLIYEIAGRTRGSAEWFQFYNEKIDNFIKKNKNREDRLRDYVALPETTKI